MASTANETEPTTAQSLAWLRAALAAWIHRLGNRLGVVPAWISEIKRELGDEEPMLSYLHEIEKRTVEQLYIAGELERFVTLSSDSSIGPVAVNSVVHQVWEEHSKSLEQTSKVPSVRLNLESNLPDAKANEKLLGEVIRSLLDNSIRAVQSRNDVLVEVRTRRLDDREIAIDISDTSSGIAPDVVDKILPKFTPKNEWDEELEAGLLISKALVESWGGTLRPIMIGATGTIVRVSLPIWETSVSISTPRPASVVEDDSHLGQETSQTVRDRELDKDVIRISTARRALVVEDESDWAEMISQIVRDRGLDVDVVGTLQEAERAIGTGDYDVALVDARLGERSVENGFSGVNIVRLLRDHNPESLIVMLTAFGEVSLVREALSAGVDEYLDKKSLSAGELNRILDKVAVRREVERESIRQSQLSRFMYEVLSMISHELRTPLVTIKDNIEVLRQGAVGPLTPDQAETVEIIHAAVRREFVLFDAHLDLNRIERGAEGLDYQEYDLVALVREEIAAHKAEADRKSIRLRAHLPEHRATVRIDVNRFRIALNPLVDNAIKFSAKGGEVSIGVRLTEGYVEVQVSDQGPGMKPDEIDRLLKWQSVEASTFTQRMRSSGLGLSMAKRMIELHNGRLWIESDGKSGTTVSFRLPIVKGEGHTNAL